MNDRIADAEEISPPSLPSYLWYELGRYLGNLAFTLGFSFRAYDYQNVPAKGPVMVIANHQSFFDPYVLGVGIRRHLVFLARKGLFRNPIFGRLISSFSAVPIDQDGVGKEGIRTIVDQLRKNKAVLIFPEGERTGTGKMVPLRPGIHLLIRRAECQIVPAGVAGAFEAYPRDRLIPTPAPIFMPPGKGSIAVCYGKPIDSRRLADMPREEVLRILFDEIHKMQQQAESLRRK